MAVGVPRTPTDSGAEGAGVKRQTPSGAKDGRRVAQSERGLGQVQGGPRLSRRMIRIIQITCAGRKIH